MGTLAIGMIKMMSVSTESIKKIGDERLFTSKVKIPFHLYDRNEVAANIVWTLKPSVASRKLLPFLKAVYGLLQDSMERDSGSQIIAALSEMHPSKRLAVADEQLFEYFQSDNLGEYIHYKLGHLPNEPLVSLYFQTIMLALADKMVMESDNGLFNFFQKLLRERLAKFQLANTLKVYITN